MCFKSPKPAPVAPVPKTPTRQDAEAATESERRRVTTEQPGVFGNIATSPLGDSDFGRSAKRLARLGG